jgi:CheY-like chemotaxis protein
MKTFLIDDDLVCNYLSEMLLTVEGFSTDIRTFASAEDALSLIKQDYPENVPEVIFLDLNMPLVSGWEFLEALSPYQEQLKGKCRIYILSSSIDQADIDRSKKCGLVCGFIQKPMDSKDVQGIAAEIKGQD